MLTLNPTPELVQSLRDMMDVGDGEAPSRITGSVWGNGKWRRICAVYPNGWKLTVNFGKLGHVTSSRASHESRIRGAAK